MHQAEKSIIDRIAPLRDSGLVVRVLPNKVAEFGVPQGRGVITLVFDKDEPQPPSGSGITQQRVLTRWVLDIRLLNIRDENGAYFVRQALYGLLIGFRPAGYEKMFALGFEFSDRSDNYWIYQAEFGAYSLLLEDDTFADEGLPLLKQIVYETLEVNGDELSAQEIEYEIEVVPDDWQGND